MSTAYLMIILFAKYEGAYSLPDGLLSAICWQESHHRVLINKNDGLLRNGIRKPEHSIGVCQLKLQTAQDYEPNITYRQLLKPENNIRIAAKHLQKQLTRYNNSIPCAVASYNAGACRMNKKNKIRNGKYLAGVLRAWQDYK